MFNVFTLTSMSYKCLMFPVISTLQSSVVIQLWNVYENVEISFQRIFAMRIIVWVSTLVQIFTALYT